MKRFRVLLLALLLPLLASATNLATRFPVAADHEAITLSAGAATKHIAVSSGYTLYLGGVLVTDVLTSTVTIHGFVNDAGADSTSIIPAGGSGVYPYFDVPLTGTDIQIDVADAGDGVKCVVYFRIVKTGGDRASSTVVPRQ